MAKNIIVGTGFSGMLAHLILGDGATVFGATNTIEIQGAHRQFLLNKLLGAKANSSTVLKNHLQKMQLHDRLIAGGNGSIWGGFVNASAISDTARALLKCAGIYLIPLRYHQTGSIDSKTQIYQLQLPLGRVLNPADLITQIQEAYLQTIQVLPDGQVLLQWRGLKSPHIQEQACESLVLAVGVVQLIDLLYRSGYLSNGDALELSEYRYQLRPTFKGAKMPENAIVIRVNILRGLLHFFGIQHYPKFFSWCDRLIPFALDQIFWNEKVSRSFFVDEGALSTSVGKQDVISQFGDSVHYCNLRINGLDANQFLKNISPSIIGLGMAFVDQKTPGPISNDILSDALKKIAIEE